MNQVPANKELIRDELPKNSRPNVMDDLREAQKSGDSERVKVAQKKADQRFMLPKFLSKFLKPKLKPEISDQEHTKNLTNLVVGAREALSVISEKDRAKAFSYLVEQEKNYRKFTGKNLDERSSNILAGI